MGKLRSTKNAWLLRICHRLVRDERITTHLGLVARALGARGIFIVSAEDEVKRKLDETTERWGGPFQVELLDGWKTFLKRWKRNGVIVHLTMYGVDVDDKIDEIRSLEKGILVVVGGGKVPREVFELADYNIAIGNQPHSEVAAAAIFLDRYFMGRELKKSFKDSKVVIVPQPSGKRLLTRGSEVQSN